MNFTIYKKGQGYYTRLCSAFAGVAIAALGCFRLKLSIGSWLPVDMPVMTNQIVSAAIPVLVFVGLALLIFQLVNKPKSAEFMIETEGEMKKVNWPAKKEVISSTKVVIFTFIAIAVIIGAIDILFRFFFRFIGIITTQG